MSTLNGKKVAIIADWLTNQGGAEQVVAAMADLFPDAPIYTSVYTPGSVPALAGRDIRGSWLQKLPAFLRKKHQFLLPFLPGAFARLDLSEFDIILSSSSAFAKSVKKSSDDQIHVCYCHTPTRYLYNARQEYLETYPLPWWLRPFKFLLPKLLDRLTRADLTAAKEVDFFISNSNYIGARIEKYYGRKATTIYPCVAVEQFAPEPPDPSEPERLGSWTKAGYQHHQLFADGYFLALGRFIPYKKFDLLVRTFAANGLPLKLAGVGPELKRCQALAHELQAKNIDFVGFVPDSQVPRLYAGARAFLFPAEEDFGLTPVEAMAAGVPVIAYGKGGATESVTGETGLFFEEQSTKVLQAAVDKFLNIEQDFSSKKIMAHAQQFSVERFQEELLEFMESKV